MAETRGKVFEERKRTSGVLPKGATLAGAPVPITIDRLGRAICALVGVEVVAIHLIARIAGAEPTSGLIGKAIRTERDGTLVARWLRTVAESRFITVPEELRAEFGGPRALAFTLRTPVWKPGVIAIPLSAKRERLASLKSLCT